MKSKVDSSLPPILVVDDEALVVEGMVMALKQQGYDVIGRCDPRLALEDIKKQKFSVIISDQMMPGMSGFELLAKSRELQPEATRILFTAVLELDTVIEAINQGEIFRFIVKPWLHEEFLATLKNGIQRYELVCQNARLQEATQAMNEQLVELNRSLEQQVRMVASQNQQLADMNAALEQNFLRLMDLCVHTMQTFYPALGNQARRVGQLCKAMAHIAPLSPEDARVLESAALLHDIGLVGVPRQIIRHWQESPESLGVAEKALINQHPILGQELALFTSSLDKVGPIIRAHHERFDGRGYPDQLGGENIPWLARLLAVAVAFAANHPEDNEAVERIKIGSGTAFDPAAVEVFLRAYRTTRLIRKERQVALSDLRPGMVLAKGIYTQTGMLLVSEGQQLNATYIEKVLNHNRIQPIVHSLVVYC